MESINSYKSYLRARIESSQGWFFLMSFVGIVILLFMGILMSLCANTSLILGVEMALLCAFPLLFLLWGLFLITLLIEQILPSVGGWREIFSSLHLPPAFVPIPFIKVPLSPPRTRLA